MTEGGSDCSYSGSGSRSMEYMDAVAEVTTRHADEVAPSMNSAEDVSAGEESWPYDRSLPPAP